MTHCGCTSESEGGALFRLPRNCDHQNTCSCIRCSLTTDLQPRDYHKQTLPQPVAFAPIIAPNDLITFQMATKYDAIYCKSCARVLATVSPTGLTPATSPDAMGCGTCQRYSALYSDVQAADADWAAQANKRDSLSKHSAREKHKKVHMEFDNWLMTVEVLATSKNKEIENSRHITIVEEQGSVGGDEQQQQGIKRRRSHSPTTQQFGSTNKQDGSSSFSPHQHQVSPLSLRPSQKRSRSTTSLPERKRLKFADKVEFHDNYRNSGDYHRPSETYVRGRNAAPEGSEYMDTSGSGQTFLKFTGVRKVGAKWVEISEEELAKKSEDTKASAELRRLGIAQNSASGEGDEDATDELKQDGSASPDARAARSARRAKGTPVASLTQNKSTRGARGSKLPRQSREDSPNRSLDEAQEPKEPESGSAALIPNAPDTLSTGEPYVVEEIGTDDAVQNKNTGKDPVVAILEAMRNRQVLEPNMMNSSPNGKNQNIIMAEHQTEALREAADHPETESSVDAAGEVPRTEPRRNTSCTASWEDAYMSSLTGTGEPATVVQPGYAPFEHNATAVISPIEEEQKLASLTNNYIDSLDSSKEVDLPSVVPQFPDVSLGVDATSSEYAATMRQLQKHHSADSHGQNGPQDTFDVGTITSTDAQAPFATTWESQGNREHSSAE
jgi:hypothetical protein